MNLNVVLRQLFADSVVQLAFVDVQVCIVFANDYIIQNQWEEVDIVTTEVQQPRIVVQGCNQMYGSTAFCHLCPNSCQFGRNVLAGVLVFQEEAWLLGLFRTVGPNLIDQIYFVFDGDVLCSQNFFVFLAFAHREHTTVESNLAAFRNLFCQPLGGGWSVINEHLHQTNAAAFHFGQGLGEVSSIRPQTGIILCDNSCSIGSAETGDELSGFEMFANILALMEVRSRNNVCVDVLLCHQLAKLFNALCNFCHFVSLLNNTR